MPSHAIRPGREGRAHRRLARRRHLLRAWPQLPVVLALATGLEVAGMHASRGNAMSQVLDTIRTSVIGAVVAALFVVVVVVMRLRMNARRAPAGRPRWQYLLAAVGWLAIASCFMLVSLRAGSGLPARASVAFGLWSGGYGLILIGRAASWGRVRALLWWDPPQR